MSQKSELIEVLDENQNIVDIKPRSYVHKHELLHAVVHVFIYNPIKGLLVQQRSQNTKTYPLQWHTAGASGHIEAGKTPEQTCCVETKEELGLSINQDELIFLGIFQDEAYVDGVGVYERAFIHAYLIMTDVTLRDISIDKNEVSTVKFMRINEVMSELNSDAFSRYINQSKEYYLDTLDLIQQKVGHE
ncbi:NUDIX domain-containing protein [Candidatus Dojkabacteria bacterium]|uniref:NUDIX domain-containing protein n=1 Tax=Candidatus Dojkabacteria bacterium TaxID=2099670 RepID=A0A955L8X7_9BACT|nr:NUDIX domain-containing protein [Candidatus Dojkabacteria bacterium]